MIRLLLHAHINMCHQQSSKYACQPTASIPKTHSNVSIKQQQTRSQVPPCLKTELSMHSSVQHVHQQTLLHAHCMHSLLLLLLLLLRVHAGTRACCIIAACLRQR
jgi:hypothetical protein